MTWETEDKATGASSTVDDAHIENAPSNGTITSDHEAYLLQRHGTLNLIPMPSSDPADPLNWPSWKVRLQRRRTRTEGRVRLLTFHAQKNINLGLIAFHGLMSTGCAVAVVPAFETFSILYHTTLTNASYLGSSQVNSLFAIAMLRKWN